MSPVSFETKKMIAESIIGGMDDASIMSQLMKMGLAPNVIEAELKEAHSHPYIMAAKKPQKPAAVHGIKGMDAKWFEWTKSNLERGCNPIEIHAILQRNNFSQAAILKVMGNKYPMDLTTPLHTIPGLIDYAKLNRRPILEKAEYIGKGKVELYRLDNYLDADECARLVDVISSQLRPSTVTTGNIHPDFRTSYTCDMGTMNEPVVAEIDAKISKTLGLGLGHSEIMQGQKYKVGQEFKAHTDFFSPESYKKYGGIRGNRTWTFMIYLNEAEQGGGTNFVEIDTVIMPKMGTAVLWNNLLEDGRPNHNTKHAGMPVEAGEKVIITKWFRERGSGEMFVEQT